MNLFRSFLIAGFECSTHRRADGKRLDVIESSRHEEFAARDYQRLTEMGIFTAREGIRWHLIESSPGHYDFSSVVPVLRAAEASKVQVIWDLFHYGWPDDVDIFSPAFVDRFQTLAAAFARFIEANAEDKEIWVCPVNEISFVAWAGGDAAYINPFKVNRGDDLKWQLVRASIAAADAVWAILPKARLAQIDPIIHIIPNPDRPGHEEHVAGYNNAQYAAWDALGGRLKPELGGDPRYLDVIGVNYYPRNQWVDHGEPVWRWDPRYRPFRTMLKEVYERFKRPIFISETGTEDDDRPEWFAHIAEETLAAIKDGVPVQGICLYPILNHPGWNDDRHCHNGLWDYADAKGDRPLFLPLADELKRYEPRLKSLADNMRQGRQGGSA